MIYYFSQLTLSKKPISFGLCLLKDSARTNKREIQNSDAPKNTLPQRSL